MSAVLDLMMAQARERKRRALEQMERDMGRLAVAQRPWENRSEFWRRVRAEAGEPPAPPAPPTPVNPLEARIVELEMAVASLAERVSALEAGSMTCSESDIKRL